MEKKKNNSQKIMIVAMVLLLLALIATAIAYTNYASYKKAMNYAVGSYLLSGEIDWNGMQYNSTITSLSSASPLMNYYSTYKTMRTSAIILYSLSFVGFIVSYSLKKKNIVIVDEEKRE
ncbi:MAG: hypothetical protein J5964_03895 [Eubacterium sp.]|nr:hypothetical protein [Eubacterium sp.]